MDHPNRNQGDRRQGDLPQEVRQGTPVTESGLRKPGAEKPASQAPMRDADRQAPEPLPNQARYRGPGGETTDESHPAGESAANPNSPERDDHR